MFNSSAKAEAFKDDAEARFAALVGALGEEERLLKSLREALDMSDSRETVDAGRLAGLIQAVEEARRASGDALERWRESVRAERSLES